MKHNSIFDILKGETRIAVDKIYSSTTWACQATFQSLSSLSRCIIMRIIFLETSFTLQELISTMSRAPQPVCQNTLEELISLYIIIEDTASTVQTIDLDISPIIQDEQAYSMNIHRSYKLNPSFRTSFVKAITRPIRPFADQLEIDHPVYPSDTKPPTVEQIERASSDGWNRLLGYLVGMENIDVPKVVIAFAADYGLRSVNSNNITSKGYEYILKDYLTQVWEFVLEAIRRSSKAREEVLLVLLMLPYMEYGKGYHTNLFTSLQQQFLFELSNVGIVYLSNKFTYFYFTSIAMDMIFGNQPNPLITGTITGNNDINQPYHPTNTLTTISKSKLSIIVETNLQVIAYVSDELHISLLKLFLEIYIRMPNMIIGRITREKSHEAYRTGIKAAQIIDFLLLHIHPKVLEEKERVKGGSAIVSLLPENVSDQLILWENELFRIQEHDCILIELNNIMGMNKTIFVQLCDHLTIQKVLLWHNMEKMMVACIPAAENEVKDFIARKVYF